MNWNLLIEHLQLAILLGGLSSGIVETLKSWIFPDLVGRKLTLISVALTAAVSGLIGYFYAGVDIQALFAAVVWGSVGAQAVYATVQELKNKQEEV